MTAGTGERPGSNLPRDPAYWADLVERIHADAVGPLAAYAGVRDAWYGVLARRAPWLVAACAAGAVIVWLALPPPAAAPAFTWIERAVAPTDAAGTLVAGDEPPPVDVLMVEFPPGPGVQR